MKTVYFDNAASTPMRSEVIEEMKKSFDIYGNPSATHQYGRQSRAIIEQVRKDVAYKLGVLSSEIIFTSGATEANNMAILGAVRDLGVKHIVSSKIEHHSVSKTIQFVEKEYGIKVTYLPVSYTGEIDLQVLENILSISQSEKKMVSLMHINNEIGTILPIKKVGNLCKQYNAYFHCDAVQSMGHYHLNLSEINVDFLSASAHKFYGPKGVGFLFIRSNLSLKGFQGGGQERGTRAGTEAFYNIVGLGKAFMLSVDNLEKDKAYVLQIKRYFVEQLCEKIPSVIFNANSSDLEKSAYSIVSFRLNTGSEKTAISMIFMDINGVACSRGSACQSGSVSFSEVLHTILPEKEVQKTNFRFSFSIFNTKQEVDYAVNVLKKFIER